MVLGSDLAGGNVDTSFMFEVFLRVVCGYIFCSFVCAIHVLSIGKIPSKFGSDVGR